MNWMPYTSLRTQRNSVLQPHEVGLSGDLADARNECPDNDHRRHHRHNAATNISTLSASKLTITKTYNG